VAVAAGGGLFALAGDHAADFKLAHRSCTIGAEIQPGGSCVLTITFAPPLPTATITGGPVDPDSGGARSGDAG